MIVLPWIRARHAVVAMDVDGYYEHFGWLTYCAWISRHILAAKEENVTKMACVIGFAWVCGRASRLFVMVDL